MHILFVNKFFHPKGGSEVVLFQERDFCRGQGFAVSDFSMRDPRNLASPDEEWFLENVDYHAKLPVLEQAAQALRFVHNSRVVARLRSLVRAKRPDVAHLHNIYHQITPAILPMLAREGVKTALTLHDYKLVCPAYLGLRQGRDCSLCRGRDFRQALLHGCGGSMARSLLLAVEAYWHAWRGSYDHVDLFLAPSRFMAESVLQRTSIDPRKVVVLPNGIDPALFAPRYGGDGHGLFFGRLAPEKGLRTLLRAIELADLPLPLRIVGDGPLAAELEGGHPQAAILGRLDGHALRREVRDASFVVFPSTWRENCSMAVLEAMAMGKPIIASRIGGLPEQVQDNVSGLLVEPGDPESLAAAMDKLSASPSLQADMGRAARRTVEERFSLAGHNQALLEHYRRLCSGKPGTD